LQSRAAELQGWRAALTAGADLLLHGCDVAQNAEGQAFVHSLALLTGAASASNVPIGGASGGPANTIAVNGNDAVQVTQPAFEAKILGNTMHSNAGLGIDLEGVAEVPAEDARARVEVVFVDTSIEDYAALLADVDPNATVVLLDSARNGLQQIAEYLANRQNVDAIHLVTHGSEGVLHLGTAALDVESMREQYAALLREIGSHLSEVADILVYGCEFGKGSAGQEAALHLSLLTGADVQASDDLTGAFILGGDWVLEFSTGQIDTGIVFREQVQSDFDHVLGNPALGLNGASGTAVSTPFTEQTPVAIAPAGTLSGSSGSNIDLLTATLIARPDGNAVESLSLNAAATAAASGGGVDGELHTRDWGALDHRFGVGGDLSDDFARHPVQRHKRHADHEQPDDQRGGE